MSGRDVTLCLAGIWDVTLCLAGIWEAKRKERKLLFGIVGLSLGGPYEGLLA